MYNPTLHARNRMNSVFEVLLLLTLASTCTVHLAQADAYGVTARSSYGGSLVGKAPNKHRPRVEGWDLNFTREFTDDKYFRKQYRMSRSTFDSLLQKLEPHMQKVSDCQYLCCMSS